MNGNCKYKNSKDECTLKNSEPCSYLIQIRDCPIGKTYKDFQNKDNG